jgi:hypothetical protein
MFQVGGLQSSGQVIHSILTAFLLSAPTSLEVAKGVLDPPPWHQMENDGARDFQF